MSQKFKSIPVSAAVLKSMVRFHEFFWFSRFFWREVCCWSMDGLYSTETRGVWRPVCSLSMYVDGLIENARAMWWSKSPSWKAPSKVSFTHLMSTKGAHEKVRLRYLKTSCSGLLLFWMVKTWNIQLSHMPHFNTRGAYFESLATGQNYWEKLVACN